MKRCQISILLSLLHTSIKGASGIELSQKSAQIPLHNYPKQDSVLIDFHYSAQSQFLCLQKIQTSQTL